MDEESESGDDSLLIMESNLNDNVLSKLKRLKIQESIITASLRKSCFNRNDFISNKTQSFDWKVYSTKLKNSVNEIKNIFEEIRDATSDSNNQLKDVDIDEVKKDVINLDNKIKSLGDFIDSELLKLQRNENELMKQLNEEFKLENKAKNKVHFKTKPYNAVVPSPIRVLINSPLKCPEVQKFQEFMSKSKNRCGGWNEYNHNIFVQIWHKYHASDDVPVLEKYMKETQRNNILRQFEHEVLEKIPGIKSNEILSHSKWYSEFCYLKTRQKTALDKWKDNKTKIKKRQNVKPNVNNSRIVNEKLCRKQNDNNKCQKLSHKGYPKDHDKIIPDQNSFEIFNMTSEISLELNEEVIPGDINCKSSVEKVKPEYKLCNGFARPTKQWINRRQSIRSEEATRTRPVCTDIENVDKLCVPKWRLGLK